MLPASEDQTNQIYENDEEIRKRKTKMVNEDDITSLGALSFNTSVVSK